MAPLCWYSGLRELQSTYLPSEGALKPHPLIQGWAPYPLPSSEPGFLGLFSLPEASGFSVVLAFRFVVEKFISHSDLIPLSSLSSCLGDLTTLGHPPLLKTVSTGKWLKAKARTHI